VLPPLIRHYELEEVSSPAELAEKLKAMHDRREQAASLRAILATRPRTIANHWLDPGVPNQPKGGKPQQFKLVDCATLEVYRTAVMTPDEAAADNRHRLSIGSSTEWR